MAIKDFKIKLGLSTIGNEFTVNTTLANTPALNVQAQTNTATLFVTTTANVGANVRVNTSGILVGNSTANLAINSTTIVLGNSAANVTINTTSFSGTAANASTLNNLPSSYFVNASNMATGTIPVARLPTGSPSTAGILQIVDSIANTSETIAASANAVKTAYDLAASAAGAAGVPGGANTNIQTNDSGSFGGFSSFTYNKTTNTISIGNSLIFATMNSTVFSKTANNASFFNGQPASFYANAENITSGTMAIARLPASSVSAAGIVQLVDAINNTSITIAATANSVKRAYDLALAANTLATAAQVAGSNTYVQFNDSGSYNGLASFTFNKTTNTISIGNSVTNATMNSTVFSGSSNNTTYLNGQLASFYTGLSSAAFSNAAARADSAYTNAVSYADTIAGTAFTNAASRADTAYSNAVSYAGTIAGTAYTNAIAIAANATNLTSGTVPSARLPTSSVSGAGIVQLVDAIDNTSITIAATANSVKRAYDNAGTAFTNAASRADSAYTNAIAIAANATNLTSGTVAIARLPIANTSSNGTIRLVDSYANTSVVLAPTANALFQAYETAVAYAGSIAGTAFTNAAARAATAYTNATSYADTKAATAYSNAVSASMAITGTSANVTIAGWGLSSNATGSYIIGPGGGLNILGAGSILNLTGSLIISGTASKPGGGSWADSSDETQKKHIIDSDIDQSWFRINTLLPREFEWRMNKDRRPTKDIGFIAQEFEKVYPYSVSLNKDGTKMIEMNFDIFSDMINTIKDLNKRLSKLEYNHKEIY